MANYLILDTETANDIDTPIVYDCGMSVINERGEVKVSKSFVNSEIFGDAEMMSTAYYAEKMPRYIADIEAGTRTFATLSEIEDTIRRLYYGFRCEGIIAHNAPFDVRALNTTKRWQTTSRQRYLIPYGAPIIDTLRYARAVLAGCNDYEAFCRTNGFVTPTGRLRFTAEVLYRYISGDLTFVESHTGLEDTMIEKEIFAFCVSQADISHGIWERKGRRKR